MTNSKFTAAMVTETLQVWCNNIVAVGKVHSEGGDVRAIVNKVLTDNYDYDSGKVLFKPTLTFGEQTFRATKDGAVSYFIGGDSNFPNDTGFKLKPWVKAWFTEEDYILHDNIAIVQCNIHLIGENGDQVFVNKSFVFKICADERIRIVLHHSSLPFVPESLS
jgi:hypothetical protein